MKKRCFSQKSLTGILLSMLMIVTTVSGCGKSKDKNDQSLIDQASSSSKDYVYQADVLDFGDGLDYSNVTMAAGRIYASTYADKGYISVSSFDPDGSNLKSFKIAESDNESHGYLSFDKGGNLYSILQVYNSEFFDDDDPHLYEEEGVADAGNEGASDKDAAATSASEQGKDAAIDTDPEEPEGMGGEDEETEDQQFLVKYDSTGKEVFRIELGTDLPEGEYYTIFKMIYTESGELLLSSNLGIEKFNEDAKKFDRLVDTTVQDSEFYMDTISLYNGAGGLVFATCWGDEGTELRTFDPATGKFGEKSSVFTNYDDYSFFGGNGYDLYVSKTDGFYGYDLKSDTITKLLDYSDSDLNVNYSISSVVAISADEFIANLPDENYNYALYRLNKIPADQVKERTVITLAGNYVDFNVRQRIYKFNQTNRDYKIKVVDYSTLSNSDDWNAGTTQFNLDIVSGNVPDIMYFGPDDPVDIYENKGLFLDLTAYLKDDPELGKVEFVTNVFDAFKSGDKLYQIVPSFDVKTVTTKTSTVGGKDTITLEECEKLIKDKGLTYTNAFGLVSRDTIFSEGFAGAGNQFIDWDAKKCNFDSEGFTTFLEFANEFPTEITEAMWQEYDETAYFTGDSLFNLTFFNGFRTYKRLVQGTFGADISMIGFPNDLGVNCSVIYPNMRFAISSQTSYPDACWELVRQFLLEDYQDSIMYDFAIRKSSFDKQGKESMERLYWIDDDGKKNYEDDYVYLGNQEIKIDPLSKEDVQVVKDFVASLDMVYSPNDNVYNIVLEEASAYFSGQKSAKEVADIIQSRLSIYVNENS